ERPPRGGSATLRGHGPVKGPTDRSRGVGTAGSAEYRSGPQDGVGLRGEGRGRPGSEGDMNDLWDASIDRRTAAVLASLSDAIVVTDPAGTILRLNPVAERLIGRGSDELAGSEPPYDYWPAEDVERLLELVRLADCEEEGAPPPWIDTAYAHVSGRRV